MNKESMSPTPRSIRVIDADVEENTIDFFAGMLQLLNKKKIHKVEWKDRKFYGHIKDEILMLHKPDGKDYQWILSEGDMNGEDYIVL